MPIFEYQCEKCGKSFEKIHLSVESSEAGAACPKCDSKKTKKKLSRFAVAGSSKGDDFGDFGGGGDDFGGDDGGDGMDAAGPGCGRCGAPQSCGMD